MYIVHSTKDLLQRFSKKRYKKKKVGKSDPEPRGALVTTEKRKEKNEIWKQLLLHFKKYWPVFTHTPLFSLPPGKSFEKSHPFSSHFCFFSTSLLRVGLQNTSIGVFLLPTICGNHCWLNKGGWVGVGDGESETKEKLPQNEKKKRGVSSKKKKKKKKRC